MEEVWVEVDGYPNYAVSNYGDVISLLNNRILAYRSNGQGYLRVALSHEGDVRDWYIHQLVAKAFFGNFKHGEQVEHVDGDLSNNATNNLALKKHRRMVFGEAPRKIETQWGKRVRIIETGEIFRTVRDCADYIGGHYSNVYMCLRGERKTHLGYSFEYHE